jgi:hypothetical protein
LPLYVTVYVANGTRSFASQKKSEEQQRIEQERQKREEAERLKIEYLAEKKAKALAELERIERSKSAFSRKSLGESDMRQSFR